MNIGEKIIKLRTQAGLSQEQLAEALAVSRQSVSKWEMGQATPQCEKILQLATLFGVSTDTLLKDVPLPCTAASRRHYFGTDGFRGEANVALTSMHAYRVGRFLGWYFARERRRVSGRARIVIGKDTRRSSYMLEYAIVAGITASGADAYMLHVTTTPSVSYVTRCDEFDCGIMITASHNPFHDNGIKVINRHGEKLEDALTAQIEAYLDGDMAALGLGDADLPLATGSDIGEIVDFASGRNRYVAYLISLAAHSYKKLRIGLDCANGASWMIASAVFSALGAQVQVIGNEPNGININKSCGSTSIEKLRRLVLSGHLDVGFAFDGDADRCIAVDETGSVVDGDKILYVLARRLQSRGMLTGDTVVSTVMSNSGLGASLARCGISCLQTAVGDRFVYEAMQAHDYALGGEHSGHIILKKYATTGDGLLTAIMLTEELCDTKQPLSALIAPVTLYPQYTRNITVRDKNAACSDPAVQAAVAEIAEKIGTSGRILLRQSGTEPVVRVMVECESEAQCQDFADTVAEVILARGHGV